ncbi:MAG: hypothetical protein LBC59_09665 [Chitinispirillales bacterium]|jgi:uncharacterized repeat protein (TIGR04138 family)|nr:hypothetical protein [Chitinispirillales bacterium]
MPPPNEFTEGIRRKIIDSGLDTRYKIGAYEFVMGGLDFCTTKIGENRHVTGPELSKALLTLAHRQFGPMAKSVLNHWGIKKTDDFGCVVYNMIRVKILDKRPADSLDDFNNVIDIDALYNAVEYFQIDKEYIRKLKGA